MAWTTPVHVTSGPASSAQFNEETVDNLLHIHDTLLGGLRIEAGTFDVSFAAASEANASPTFGTAFASAPFVVVTARTVTGEEMVTNVTSVTASGMVVRCGVADGSSITATVACNYIAIGTPA